MQEILEKVKVALTFITSLSEELYNELSEPSEWHKYPELSYIFDMDELF